MSRAFVPWWCLRCRDNDKILVSRFCSVPSKVNNEKYEQSSFSLLLTKSHQHFLSAHAILCEVEDTRKKAEKLVIETNSNSSRWRVQVSKVPISEHLIFGHWPTNFRQLENVSFWVYDAWGPLNNIFGHYRLKVLTLFMQLDTIGQVGLKVASLNDDASRKGNNQLLAILFLH